LASAGASVIVADRDGDAAERGAADLCAAGGSAIGYQVDVSSQAQLKGLFDFTARHHGSLNVLFSAVGIRGPESFEVTEEEFDLVFNINVKQHFFATRLAQPLMRPCAPYASIIYMGSAAGLRYVGGSPLYAISKASLLMMSRAFARHLGPDGIRVNALCPGPIDTAFSRQGVDAAQRQVVVERWMKEIPLQRIADTSDVANVVRFLASDQSLYLTGLLLPVDGGLTA
jgi:NAD(P)-dependent dehydrogenase (short-subunit alcohol dehydrogenase family)